MNITYTADCLLSVFHLLLFGR